MRILLRGDFGFAGGEVGGGLVDEFLGVGGEGGVEEFGVEKGDADPAGDVFIDEAAFEGAVLGLFDGAVEGDVGFDDGGAEGVVGADGVVVLVGVGAEGVDGVLIGGVVVFFYGFKDAGAGGVDVLHDDIDALGDEGFDLFFGFAGVIPAGVLLGDGDVGVDGLGAGFEAALHGGDGGEGRSADDAKLAGFGDFRGDDAELVGSAGEIVGEGLEVGVIDIAAGDGDFNFDGVGFGGVVEFLGDVEVFVAVGDDQGVAAGVELAEGVGGGVLGGLLTDANIEFVGGGELIEGVIGELVPAAVGGGTGDEEADFEG